MRHAQSLPPKSLSGSHEPALKSQFSPKIHGIRKMFQLSRKWLQLRSAVES